MTTFTSKEDACAATYSVEILCSGMDSLTSGSSITSGSIGNVAVSVYSIEILVSLPSPNNIFVASHSIEQLVIFGGSIVVPEAEEETGQQTVSFAHVT